MSSMRRTALAWRNLTHNRRRLIVALCGIGFAVVLMFTEMGFNNALFDSSVKVLDDLNADLIIASAANNTILSGETFDRQRVIQAGSVAGVTGAYPLYIQLYGALWKGPHRKGSPIRVLACDVNEPVFRIPQVGRHAALLQAPDSALFDRKSKKEKYGDADLLHNDPSEAGAELNGRLVRVVGTFEMGTDFSCDGTTIVSDWNFSRYCPDHGAGKDPLSAVDLGVVQVADRAQTQSIRAQLNQMLAPDAKVWTKEEFIDREKRFLNESTGLGFIFQLGMWLGFLVGVITCYQIINADISDHLRELATLKAMGYGNRYFVALVMKQSLCLSLLSFIPAVVLSAVIYAVLAKSTGLLMLLTAPRAGSIFLWTITMCAASGCLAMRRVFAADPAELY